MKRSLFIHFKKIGQNMVTWLTFCDGVESKVCLNVGAYVFRWKGFVWHADALSWSELGRMFGMTAIFFLLSI